MTRVSYSYHIFIIRFSDSTLVSYCFPHMTYSLFLFDTSSMIPHRCREDWLHTHDTSCMSAQALITQTHPIPFSIPIWCSCNFLAACYIRELIHNGDVVGVAGTIEAHVLTQGWHWTVRSVVFRRSDELCFVNWMGCVSSIGWAVFRRSDATILTITKKGRKEKTCVFEMQI